MYQVNERVRHLFAELKLPYPCQFSLLKREYEKQVQGGEFFRKWKLLQVELAKPSPFEDPSKVAEMKQGLIAKASAQGKPAFTEQQLEERLLDIRRNADQKKAKLVSEAASLWEQVHPDPEYHRYLQLSEIWIQSGFSTMANELTSVESADGEDKGRRGKAFEEQYSLNAFQLVKQRFEAAPWNPNTNADQLQFVRSVSWKAESQVRGEVDVLVYFHDAASDTRTVVAIVECKLSCYEICSGYHQQQERLTAHRQLQLVDSRRTSYFIDPLNLPQVFVATRLPTSSFNIGVDIAIAISIKNALFAPKVMEWKSAVDTPAKVHDLMQHIRKYLGLSAALSPAGFLSEVW
jgi:hypothetical protein